MQAKKFIAARSGCRALIPLGAVLAQVCLLVATAHGQAASTGAIRGTITDPTGAAVPGAEVTVTSVGTGRTLKVTSSGEGFYSVEGLPAGVYDVSAREQGFKTYVAQSVKVDPGERVRLDMTLEVGEVRAEVRVTANAVKVETQSGESSGVITSEQIQQLLLNGRNYLSLALLIPGVNVSSVPGRIVGGGELAAMGHAQSPLSINGMGRDFSANYTIDGAANLNNATSVLPFVQPSLDAVSEFRVLKNSYSAKYGMTGSAQVMAETKSGTQSFHGALYEYLRNDRLDASNFFAPSVTDPRTGITTKSKTPLKQHNFGFALSGPLYIPGKYNTEKKKTFFFVSEEWWVRHFGRTLRGAVFTEEMRRGDFTSSPTRPPTDLVLGSGARDLLGRLYPGVDCLPEPNKLNPACFEPNAVRLMNTYWPLPNNIIPGQFLNYINPSIVITNDRKDAARVDHNFGERLVLTGRFMKGQVLEEFPNLGSNPAPTTRMNFKTTSLNALLRLTANISPTMVNQFGWSAAYDKVRIRGFNTTLPAGVAINYAFKDANVLNEIPTISITRGWAGLENRYPINDSDGVQTFSDDFSVVKGRHVFEVGGVFIAGVKRQPATTPTNGSFSFSGVHTGDPAADYLLGLSASFFQTDVIRRNNIHYRVFEPYFQDDWKVTRRLTLNLGLRYQYLSPDVMEGEVSNFDPARWDPTRAPVVQPDGTFVLDSRRNPLTASGAVADVLNGVIFAGKDGVPDGFIDPWRKGFAPRFGFAWDIFGDGKTALRGGYGIGYHRQAFNITAASANTPFVNSITLLNGALRDPTIGVPGAKTPTGMTILKRSASLTMIQSWSVTLQREIVPNAVFNVAYVGSGARHVKGSFDINFPTTAIRPSIANPACLQAGQDPGGEYEFDPCLNRNLVSSNLTRPFIGWGSLNSGHGHRASYHDGTSNYHSLQGGFQYRATRGLTLNTAYTWGKVLSDTVSRDTTAINFFGGAQNPRNYRAEKGPPGFDRAHIFTTGYIYDLPFWRERTNVLGKVLGNWTFSGITVVQSGFTFTPGCATGTCGLASRPNLVGSVEGPRTVQQWFNTAAFTAPAFGFFGNAGTGIIRGPGEQTWNWALFKNFPFRRESKIQFRAEFFNIWNHPNFTGISTALGAPNFGQVVSAMEQRIIEFALRLDF